MMTTALALDKQTEIFPAKGIHGFCLTCGNEVISKCGTIVSHHFAHTIDSDCGRNFHDHKSEWHRAWQLTVDPQTPGKTVEVIVSANKEIKRADVISNSGFIIEFQHSHLPVTEREGRENHYKNMIWVVHSDKEQSRTWKKNTSIRVFYNGDNNTVYWYPRSSSLKLTIQKQDFIDFVINNPFFTLGGFGVKEKRSINKLTKKDPWYLGLMYHCDPATILLHCNSGSSVMAMVQIATMDIALRDYFKEQKRIDERTREIELLESKERIVYQSLVTQSDAIGRYHSEIDKQEYKEYLTWLSKVYMISQYHCKVRLDRFYSRELSERNKSNTTFSFWYYFNNVIFPSVKKDWAISMFNVDKTPLPKTTQLQRLQKRAKDKTKRRSRA